MSGHTPGMMRIWRASTKSASAKCSSLYSEIVGIELLPAATQGWEATSRLSIGPKVRFHVYSRRRQMSQMRKAADVLGKISRTRQLDQKRNTSFRAIDIPNRR
jgi:hypothetical protein